MASPTVRAYGSPSNGADAVPAFAVNQPAGVATGDLLLAFAAGDTTTTAWTASPGNGWVRLSNELQSTTIQLAVYAKVATGADALTIGATNNNDYSVVMVAIVSHGVFDVATEIVIPAAATAATGNADPPASGTVASKDWLAFAACAVDMTATGDAVSAAPTNYTTGAVLTKSAASTSSVGLGVGHRALTAATSEDPGTFTNTSRPWIAKTILVPPLGSYTGTVAVTLAEFTSTATGTAHEDITGTVAATLAAFTSDASGTFSESYTSWEWSVATEDADASVSAYATPFTVTHGEVTITGTVAATLDDFTSAATGTAFENITGTVAATLASFTSSATGTGGTDTYVLNDDFGGSSLDETKWRAFNRIGDLANNEVNCIVSANVTVSSGTLKIESRFEDATCSDTWPSTHSQGPVDMDYTSGQIAQYNCAFKYGIVEVRAKMPGGTGLWPCIWMLGWQWQDSHPYTANESGHNWPVDGWCELDIAEFALGDRDSSNCALHWQTANASGSGFRELGFDASSQFAVYRLEWTPTSVTWKVDDGGGFDTLQTISGSAGVEIPDEFMFLMIHTAIGGTFGGTPNSSTFPQTLEVDYARIIATDDTEITVAGTVAATLGAFTSTASGTAEAPTVTGTVAVTLDPFTSSATGTHAVSGSSASTLAAFTSTATGTAHENITGTVAQTLAAFTSAASGTHSITGTVAATLADFTSTATGTAFESITGTSTTTLDPFTSTASGTASPPGIAGTVAATLAPFTSTASGTFTPQSVTGTVAATLASFTSTATGMHGTTIFEALITGEVTGPAIIHPTLSGPDVDDVLVGAIGVSRQVTGPATDVVSLLGSALGVLLLTGPALRRVVTGPAVEDEPTVSSGPETSRVLTGASV